MGGCVGALSILPLHLAQHSHTLSALCDSLVVVHAVSAGQEADALCGAQEALIHFVLCTQSYELCGMELRF